MNVNFILAETNVLGTKRQFILQFYKNDETGKFERATVRFLTINSEESSEVPAGSTCSMQKVIDDIGKGLLDVEKMISQEILTIKALEKITLYEGIFLNDVKVGERCSASEEDEQKVIINIDYTSKEYIQSAKMPK